MSHLTTLRSRVRRTPRRPDRGAVVALVAVGMVPLMLAAALVVDGGRYWVERTQAQTASEAGVITAAKRWAATGTACATAVTETVKANAGPLATATCSAPGGANGGRVDVTASEQVVTLFGDVLRRSSTTTRSQASILTGGANSATGLRPLALCVNHPIFLQWVAEGFPSGRRVIFDLSGSNINCDKSGNWAVLNFDGTKSIQSWIDNGYGSLIQANQVVGGDPGILSNNISFSSAYGKQILLALFDPAFPTGTGSNTQFKLVAFASVTLHNAQLTGSPRFIDVTLTRTVTTSDRCCVPSEYNRGYVAWKLCSFVDESLQGTGNCS
jgi:Flp pilus assembly protein TadG